MENRLKPMGVRDVLDNTFSVLRNNFWSFQGVIFKAFLPAWIILLFGIIIGAVYIFMIANSTSIPINDSRFWSGLFSTSLLSTLLILLFLIVLGVAFVIALIIGGIYFIYGNLQLFKAGLHHEQCNSKQAFAGIKEKRVKLFLVQFILGIFIYMIMIPGMIATIATSFFSPSIGNIVSLANNVLVIFISFLFCLSPQVAVFEDLDVIKCIGRSFKLLAKHRWRIFWTFFLLYILGYVLGLITLAILATPIVLAFIFKNVIMYILAFIFVSFGLLILNLLFSFYYGPTTAIYYDLLIRKEGYDLKLELTDPIVTEAPSQSLG